MVLAKSPRLCTFEEYLALERDADERHEYLDGQIYLMAGESLAHGIISVNVVAELGSQLRGKPCQALSGDMKVRGGPEPNDWRMMKGFFFYPDVVVICGEPKFHDKRQDVLTNPTVTIEILSPSTEGFDRGDKFRRYRSHLPTLVDYLLIAQDAPVVDRYHRKEDDTWHFSSTEGLEQSLYIETIDCTLRLNDIYDRVVFPAEPGEESQDDTSNAE